MIENTNNYQETVMRLWRTLYKYWENTIQTILKMVSKSKIEKNSSKFSVNIFYLKK